jgi:hypothetical protein
VYGDRQNAYVALAVKPAKEPAMTAFCVNTAKPMHTFVEREGPL